MNRFLRDSLLLLASLTVGLLVLAGVILAIGANPVAVGAALMDGAFGNPYRLANTMVQAIPLLLTGLSVALAFRGQLFNIGAEGQLLVGAIAATAVGVMKIPPAIHLPLALLAGAAAGAGWAGIAAWLKVGRGVPEVLSTLLLNFVAMHAVAYAIRGPLQETDHLFPQSDPIAVPARFSLLVPQTPLHSGAVLALFLAFAVWFYLRCTAGGFALRAVGAGAEAAEAVGIPLARTRAFTFLLSGALAGLAGAVQICGVLYRLSDGFSPGYGYTAIAVALIANLSPIFVVPSAIFFGALAVGGAAVQQRISGVSSVVVQVLQAVTLFALLGYYRAREYWARREGKGGE